MKKIKKKYILNYLTGLILLFFVFSLVNFSQAQFEIPEIGVETVLLNIINWMAGMIGLVALMMIMFAGFTWMTASGNQDQIDKARKWLIGAVIGATVGLGSWAIISVVLESFFQ